MPHVPLHAPTPCPWLLLMRLYLLTINPLCFAVCRLLRGILAAEVTCLLAVPGPTLGHLASHFKPTWDQTRLTASVLHALPHILPSVPFLCHVVPRTGPAHCCLLAFSFCPALRFAAGLLLLITPFFLSVHFHSFQQRS
ncbi:hypothetical protein B0J11DRAFT_35638 [Dendryphion nanum]|uniref:Uncharacterized protein n=1 Tax=Dendryphion nanum TaxID=256645 RepID=A0A9P9IXA8_9PLEO|nr:hypothetical protein B0J11DRAFT_35638 [Dendryphion nanum]